MPDTATGRRFTRRPIEVVALPYDGANEAEMAGFLGGHFGVFKGEAAVLTRNGWKAIYATDVAVLGPGGTVDVMEAADFAAEYAEADRD
jgi:hypothetical protein